MLLTLSLPAVLIFTLCGASPAPVPQAQAQAPSLACTFSLLPSPTATFQPSPFTEEEITKLYDLHEKLVDIPSISKEEVECAEFVNEYLTSLGYHVEKIPVENGSNRYNVFAYPKELQEQDVWPEVLITSHLDTVS
jgi:acetylornithine deacetylase